MNPLLPLITNLSTRNREYVVLVGAGFSKDAGVQSSWDILIDTLKPLYISDNKIEKSSEIKYEEIEKWYINHSEYSKLGYSSILEQIYKGEIERRQHLKKYFEGLQPGESHKLLALMVKSGFVRFIFTTNFDDLIEKALDELNISYDVIFSDDILNGSISWDKVKECRIYKLHGDYKTGKVKNTIAELSSLDVKLSEDFQYIIDRHGLIVVGYAGRDEGIMTHLLKRNFASYPIYWQYVNFPPTNDEYKHFNKLKDASPNNSIIFVKNSSASNFLREVLEGIENLDRHIISSEKSKFNYEGFVLNQNEKKIRALTLTTINDFISIYDKFTKEANKHKEYIKKYQAFNDCCNEIEFIYDYADTLITYNLFSETDFLFSGLIKYTSAQNWLTTDDFLEPSITYMIISIIGSLLVKHGAIELINKFYEFNRKRTNNYFPILDFLNYFHNGWLYVKSQSEFKNSVTPHFDIIISKHLPKTVSRDEFISFDIYLSMDIAIKNSNINWFCYSRNYVQLFELIFHTYFNKRIRTSEQAIQFVDNMLKQQTVSGWYPDGLEEIIKSLFKRVNHEDLINSYLLKIS